MEEFVGPVFTVRQGMRFRYKGFRTKEVFKRVKEGTMTAEEFEEWVYEVKLRAENDGFFG